MFLKKKFDTIYFDGLLKKNPNVWGHKYNTEIKTISNIIKNGNVLDLGVGTGRNLLYFARLGYICTGVDCSQLAVERLKYINENEKLSIDIEMSDISNYNLQSDYDIILCNGLLHFLTQETSTDLIRRIKMHTNKGGINHLSVFTDKSIEKNRFEFLFKKNDLKSFYTSWDIISYKEIVIERNENIPIGIAKIIAKKN